MSSQILFEEKTCREDVIKRCFTLFKLVIVELNTGEVGFIIEYRGKKFYIPPIIGNDKVPLPLKYARLFDRVIFPEILPVRYGKR